MAPRSLRQWDRDRFLDSEMRNGYPAYAITSEEREYMRDVGLGPRQDEFHDLPRSVQAPASALELTEREAA